MYKFSYDELKRFLIDAKKFAPIVPMKESNSREGKYIILRHDADLDIYPSYEVSKIEKEIGGQFQYKGGDSPECACAFLPGLSHHTYAHCGN